MEVTREVVLEAPLDEVWEALTDPEQLEEWFSEDGEERELVVEEVETGRRVAYTWEEGTSRSRSRRSATARASSSPRPASPAGTRLRAALARVRLRVSDVFDALGDPTRRHIVESLSGRGGVGDAARGGAAGDAPGGREASDGAARGGARRLAQARAARRSTGSTPSRSTRPRRGSCASAASGTRGWSGCATSSTSRRA